MTTRDRKSTIRFWYPNVVPRSVTSTLSFPVERTLSMAWRISGGDRNCPFLILTARPVGPSPTARSRVIATRRVPSGPRSALGLPELPAGTDKAPEERMGEHRLRLELGMELAGQEIRMVLDLHDLHETAIGGLAADPHSLLQHGVEVLPVHFVAVAVPLADLRPAVGAMRLRPRFQDTRPFSEAHVPSHALHSLQLPQLVNHRIRGARIELCRVGVLQAADVAR